LNEANRQNVEREVSTAATLRLTRVLPLLGVAASSWYRRAEAGEPRRRGPAPKGTEPVVEQAVVSMAEANPWYGYKRIAVMCRREGQAVTNRDAYRVMKAQGLLHKRRRRPAELYQASKLFELLPSGPNELWQMDVTYVHIPGYGWWYAVTVIDYYSRYLLAVRLTFSYCASEVIAALKEARAAVRTADQAALSGHRQRLVVHRPTLRGVREGSLCPRPDPVPHADATGPAGAVSSDVQGRRGLLAAV
jgi:transposase InsO family protein